MKYVQVATGLFSTAFMFYLIFVARREVMKNAVLTNKCTFMRGALRMIEQKVDIARPDYSAQYCRGLATKTGYMVDNWPPGSMKP